MPAAPPKHFLQISDFTLDEFEHLIARTRWIKDRFKRYELYQPLRDRTLAMVFEKASTRTRVSFEAGMNQLGGIAINLNRDDTHLSRGEPIEDVARVISRMVDVVMIRTFEQTIIERFAAHSRVPVINGLTNEYHPCQILADIYTYIEHRGSIRGRTVAWIGDSNNVCSTWLQAAAIFDFRVHVSTPPGYEMTSARAGAPATATSSRSPIRSTRAAAPTSSPPTCGRAWASKRRTTRARAISRNGASTPTMMREAKPDALFMHCLPAHRGEEVTAEVIDGPQSVVWDEAENRLHAQKALLEYLVCGRVESHRRPRDDRSHRRQRFERREEQGVLPGGARAARLRQC